MTTLSVVAIVLSVASMVITVSGLVVVTRANRAVRQARLDREAHDRRRKEQAREAMRKWEELKRKASVPEEATDE